MNFRKRVTLFSFILTFIVIWIHAIDPKLVNLTQADLKEISDRSTLLCYHIQMLLGTYLGQLAVPGFFCMSGYLFFRNLSIGANAAANKKSFLEGNEKIALFDNQYKKNLKEIASKLKSRVRSLVLPFLIWNAVYYIIYIIAGRAEFAASELLRAVFINKYNPVFWYIRELIIINLLTPFILIFIRSGSGAFVMLLLTYAAAVCYESLPVHIVNEDALFYYVCGAAAAVHIKGFVEGVRVHGDEDSHNAAWLDEAEVVMGESAVSAAGIILYLISIHLVYSGRYGTGIVLAAAVGGRICGVAALYSVLCLITSRVESKLPCFMHYNFFIYAVHYLEIRLFRLIMVEVGLSLIIMQSMGFILMPVLSVASAVIAANLIKKMSPALYALVTGGRN